MSVNHGWSAFIFPIYPSKMYCYSCVVFASCRCHHRSLILCGRRCLLQPAIHASASTDIPGGATIVGASINTADDGGAPDAGVLTPPCGTKTHIFYFFFFLTTERFHNVWFNLSLFHVCICAHVDVTACNASLFWLVALAFFPVATHNATTKKSIISFVASFWAYSHCAETTSIFFFNFPRRTLFLQYPISEHFRKYGCTRVV